ncbi:Chromodomain Y-like protein, partial [Leucoagaricus sp. SymC.cos]
PPPPDLVNTEKEWEVEEIQDHQKWGRGVQYLVYWKGYSDEEDQWLPKSHLSNMEEAIQEYLDRFSEQT